jgi:hypothetical protein
LLLTELRLLLTIFGLLLTVLSLLLTKLSLLLTELRLLLTILSLLLTKPSLLLTELRLLLTVLRLRLPERRLLIFMGRSAFKGRRRGHTKAKFRGLPLHKHQSRGMRHDNAGHLPFCTRILLECASQPSRVIQYAKF